ncbi:MAG: hypothetical protein ACOX0H_02940 [Patescibacteria group bacterium]|jgi:hypothetical protein
MNIFLKIIKEWKEAWKDSKEKQKSFQDRIDKENEKFEKEEKEANFFRDNVLNSEIITKNKGSLPIKSYQVGNIIIDKEKKTAQIEIRQAETIGKQEQGAWYHVPFYAVGHFICKNIEYKIGETNINGGVFSISRQENKLKLFLNHNRQGVEIICEEIEALDFKEQKMNIKDFQDIEMGMKWGKYFSIKEI